MISARTKTLAFILTAFLCGSTYAAAQTSSAMSTYAAGQSGTESTGTTSSSESMQGPTSENPFLGGVPQGSVQKGVISLSLFGAIRRGLKYNLGLLLSDQATAQARGARIQALSRLLPQISAGTSETSEQINLKALGFPSFPGVPDIIGPFGVFDVRGYIDQPVLNLKDLHQAKADADNLKAAQYSYQNARDLVVLVSADLYLETVAGSSRITAAQAEVKTAKAVYDRAVDMKQAGMVPSIDVLRSQVELQAEEQRLIFLKNRFQTEKLRLARAIGLHVAQKFQLTSKVPYSPPPPITLNEALNRALQTRSDYKSLLAQVQAAEALKKAARSERLPSVNFHADYGDIGPSPGDSHGTYTVEANLKIPIFQGGKVRGDEMAANALLQQRESELKDLRNQIAYQVRKAFMDLQSSDDQVHVAKSTQTLAHEQIKEARDRFAAGVVNSLEVVQAQQAVARADESYISSLFQYNAAKASLARALGLADTAFKQMIGGNK